MLRPVKCPDCGAHIMTTFEHLYALANTNGVYYDDGEDVITYEHTGYTDVMYDTQETLGIACESCGWADVRTHMLSIEPNREVILLVAPGKEGDPVTVTFNLDEMNGPQSFTIDPDKGVIIPTELAPEKDEFYCSECMQYHPRHQEC